MKRNLLVLLSVLAIAGCARFSTKQTDSSYEKDSKVPARTITTKASAWTFISSSSELAKFKATQSDKTQSASVGSLTQSSSIDTNLVTIISTAISAAVRATK